MESSINYGMERVWSIGVTRGTNAVSVGYDEGVVLMKMGSEEPVASMDATGRIIYARHNDVHTAVIKALGSDYEITDGERLPLPVKVHSRRSCKSLALCTLSVLGLSCPVTLALKLLPSDPCCDSEYVLMLERQQARVLVCRGWLTEVICVCGPGEYAVAPLPVPFPLALRRCVLLLPRSTSAGGDSRSGRACTSISPLQAPCESGEVSLWPYTAFSEA